MKKSIIVLSAFCILFASCSKDFLTRDYAGGSLTQEQFDKLSSEKIHGTLRGIYAMLYTMNSDDHDEFGQRSIDLWGDILCGDIAVTNKTYGWLYQDEQMLTFNRTATIWSFYYDIIHNANTTIKSIENSSNISNLIESNGYPEDGKYSYSSEETNYALFLAQALSIRAYCYANLARWYTPVPAALGSAYNVNTYKCCPLYNINNMDTAQALSSTAQIYNQVFKDITFAINLFDKFGEHYYELNDANYARESKLEIDINVARGLAAYAYLNAAPYYENIGEGNQQYYKNACKYAEDVINSGTFTIIPNDKLCSTGFNDVTDASWMWGEDVVTETAGGLKSWFGQMDIHSYSYAWAGDTKVIDENLKTLIPNWDGRSKWFNDGEKNSKFKDCPDGKFFSAACPTSTKDEDIDREWLSDNVFMRIECMHLIAAEAHYFLGEYADAKDHLRSITKQRLNSEYPNAETEEESEMESLTGDAEKLIKAISYNWRIEMWGEGYGLQTFRRLVEYAEGGERKRGGNHDYAGGKDVKSSDDAFNMQIPTSEATYNPNIK